MKFWNKITAKSHNLTLRVRCPHVDIHSLRMKYPRQGVILVRFLLVDLKPMIAPFTARHLMALATRPGLRAPPYLASETP